MKPVNNCVVENCIPTPTSCGEWNGGDIKFLGICDGDSLNTIVWEIVGKLQDIASEDISKFDIDTMLKVCDQKAPTEVSLISILTILKENDICLKDYIVNLQETVNALSKEQNVKVDLKCFSDFDNIGNALTVTRDQLDQLVINNLCSQKARIEYLEGVIVTLQSQVDAINADTTVNEKIFTTCVDPIEKPTSSQVVSIATKVCAIETSLNNLITTVTNLTSTVNSIGSRVTFIEDNCCAATCDDVKLGFTALFNEDNSGVVIRFTWGAGTVIPSGFVDKGSTGTVTDVNGNVVSFAIDIVDNNANNNETEVLVAGLNLASDLTISITAKVGNDTLTCEKCLYKIVKSNACGFCQICAEGAEGSSIVIMYESASVSIQVEASTTTTTSTSTTTTSTTTTTTLAP